MKEDPSEERLLGGNTSAGVVRIGSTVRRTTMPWSNSVDALLRHLEEAGFEGAPRAMGYDDLGRQTLSFVDGYVDPDPADLDLTRLRQVGQLIRYLHDATSSFAPRPEDLWNVAIVPDSEDLICHNDLAPWNLVRTANSLTFIDWDGAGPGSRLWDLAYAAHGFVPLSPDAGLSDEVAAARLKALVEGYGVEEKSHLRFVTLLGRRVRSMYELLQRGHESGEEPWSRLWTEGHARVWLADTLYVEKHRRLWEGALAGNVGVEDST
jgi:hypothetical protein